MDNIKEAKRLLGEAQALMYVDVPPGKNEPDAYQIITEAMALLDKEKAEQQAPAVALQREEIGWPPNRCDAENHGTGEQCLRAEHVGEAHKYTSDGPTEEPPVKLPDNPPPGWVGGKLLWDAYRSKVEEDK